nr:DUF4365 and DUF1817 domain-containing protein [uncultured Holophaga sp.]
MSPNLPKYSRAARQGDLGVDIVSRVITNKFGWLFRRIHQEHDFGIDAQVDIVLEDGSVTGQVFALQIKCGRSFFEDRNHWGFIYHGSRKHFNYLDTFPMPVLIVLCEPETQECYWEVFDPAITSASGNNWKMTIPRDNVLAGSRETILNLLPPKSDAINRADFHWAMNDAIEDHDCVLYVVSRQEVDSLDISNVLVFFDRIRLTRELAMHCQGKIEISFHGYDEDPRELFEIPEIRSYVPRFIEAVQDLFFFVYTGERAQGLRNIMLCLADVEVKSRIPGENGQIPIEINTDKVAQFLESHFPGLNRMTNWLKMPIEENRRISNAVIESMGFNPEPD